MMKKIIFLFCLVFIVLFTIPGYTKQAQSEQQEFKYVGSKKCAPCHRTEKSGNQYIKWLKGNHALAYWRLGSDWAKHLAQQREEYKDIKEPINEHRCLKCHYTGAGQPAESFAASFYKEEGVGCEACHGPGSAYMKPSIMKDRKKFLANGGIIPSEKTCKKCHRDNGFKFQEYLKKILHPAAQGTSL